jgi:hypothetical protein
LKAGDEPVKPIISGSGVVASLVAMWPGNKLTFYHFAGACAFLYVSAQAFQEIVFDLYGDHEENFEASIHQRLNGADQARALILLISFFGLLVVFSAITMRCSRRTPGPSVFGLVCGCLWITAELFYRTVDLFLVTKVWTSEYQRIGTGSQQTVIGQWIHNWDQFVWAWYFVLLAAFFVSSISLGLAVRGTQRTDNIMSILFFANGVLMLGRLLAEYAGQSWLSVFNNAFYFPVTVAVFGFLGFWLMKSGELVVASEALADDKQ